MSLGLGRIHPAAILSLGRMWHGSTGKDKAVWLNGWDPSKGCEFQTVLIDLGLGRSIWASMWIDKPDVFMVHLTVVHGHKVWSVARQSEWHGLYSVVWIQDLDHIR